MMLNLFKRFWPWLVGLLTAATMLLIFVTITRALNTSRENQVRINTLQNTVNTNQQKLNTLQDTIVVGIDGEISTDILENASTQIAIDENRVNLNRLKTALTAAETANHKMQNSIDEISAALDKKPWDKR